MTFLFIISFNFNHSDHATRLNCGKLWLNKSFEGKFFLIIIRQFNHKFYSNYIFVLPMYYKIIIVFRHDITEILLKVALSIMTGLTPDHNNILTAKPQ
jgi:hypothetical protein